MVKQIRVAARLVDYKRFELVEESGGLTIDHSFVIKYNNVLRNFDEVMKELEKKLNVQNL